jgi:hypothetical protein
MQHWRGGKLRCWFARPEARGLQPRVSQQRAICGGAAVRLLESLEKASCLACGQTVAHAGNSRRRFTLLGVGPAPGTFGHRPPRGGIRVHSRAPRNRCCGRRRWRHLGRRPRPCRPTQGREKGCGRVPAAGCTRAHDRQLGRADRIAAMPKRPGQTDKGDDSDVLPVVKGGIAVLVGPIQRRGRLDVRPGLQGNRRQDPRMSEDAMAAVRPVPADFGNLLSGRKLAHATSNRGALYQHIDPHEN